MMRDSRIASRSSCSVNRRAAGGSSIAPSRSVSAAARIEATGVFSSCEAFATKSRRIAWSCRAWVMSRTTSRTSPSAPIGQRGGAEPPRRRADLDLEALDLAGRDRPQDARCSSSGQERFRAVGDRVPRWLPRAAFANNGAPSAARRSTPSSMRPGSPRARRGCPPHRAPDRRGRSAARSSWRPPGERAPAPGAHHEPRDQRSDERRDEDFHHRGHAAASLRPPPGRSCSVSRPSAGVRRTHAIVPPCRADGPRVHPTFTSSQGGCHLPCLALPPVRQPTAWRGSRNAHEACPKWLGYRRSRRLRDRGARLGERDTDSATASGSGGAVSGTLTISGSSTVQPITQLVTENFTHANPDVSASVDGPGTGDGFVLFCEGKTDISDASRQIEDPRKPRPVRTPGSTTSSSRSGLTASR